MTIIHHIRRSQLTRVIGTFLTPHNINGEIVWILPPWCALLVETTQS